MSRFILKELIKSFHLAYLLWSSDHFPRIETHLTAIMYAFPPFLATDQLQLEVTPRRAVSSCDDAAMLSCCITGAHVGW